MARALLACQGQFLVKLCTLSYGDPTLEYANSTAFNCLGKRKVQIYLIPFFL